MPLNSSLTFADTADGITTFTIVQGNSFKKIKRLMTFGQLIQAVNQVHVSLQSSVVKGLLQKISLEEQVAEAYLFLQPGTIPPLTFCPNFDKDFKVKLLTLATKAEKLTKIRIDFLTIVLPESLRSALSLSSS